MRTPFQITIDCADAPRMVAFWSVALGYVQEPPPAGYLSWDDYLRSKNIAMTRTGCIGAIVDPDGVGPRILFLRRANAPTPKRPVQFDIRAGRSEDVRAAKVADLLAAGATSLRRVEENGQWWMVMADPEGNEFCVT